MKQIFIYILIIVIFICCNKEKNNILTLSIDNQSDSKIEKIKLYANIGVTKNNFIDSLTINVIEKSQNYKTEWHLYNLLKVDGDFIINFQRDTIQSEKEFGYFSNGILIEKNYNIKIENDTIIVSK